MLPFEHRELLIQGRRSGLVVLSTIGVLLVVMAVVVCACMLMTRSPIVSLVCELLICLAVGRFQKTVASSVLASVQKSSDIPCNFTRCVRNT